jgi:hypothetical protein
MTMKKTLLMLVMFTSLAVFAEDAAGPLSESISESRIEETGEGYQDYGVSDGITIYGGSGESLEAGILARLNGFSIDRQRFIEQDLLRSAGFQRGARIKVRRTTGAEKSMALLQGMVHAFLSSVPLEPFFEIEYDGLPEGEFYLFESIIYGSPLNNVSPEVRTAMELEYMLQVGFSDGVLIRGWNVNYYTEENIARFEELARSLPDTSPAIQQLKIRYLNDALPRIRGALERYRNPSESALRARQNLSDAFGE